MSYSIPAPCDASHPGCCCARRHSRNAASCTAGMLLSLVMLCVRCNLTPHTSHLTPHTSHLTPHTSHPTPHTSHPTPHTSHLTPHTSHLAPHTSHLTPHTSHLTPHTSHLTPHTSHLTPHTLHLTPHTSHLTPHTSHLTRPYRITHWNSAKRAQISPKRGNIRTYSTGTTPASHRPIPCCSLCSPPCAYLSKRLFGCV